MSHMPAATAAALPPELPPAERGCPSNTPGLCTRPWIEKVECELSGGVSACWGRIAGGVGSAPHAKLVHVGLTDDDSAGVFELLHDRRIERRDVVCHPGPLRAPLRAPLPGSDTAFGSR